MLAAVKYVADDNFVCQQDSVPAYCALSTVQLMLKHKILNVFLSYDPRLNFIDVHVEVLKQYE